MSFRHDSTGVNPDATFDLLPEAWYTFRIHDAEEMESKNGNPMILAKCEVIGDHEASVWHYVTFLPKDQKGAGVSVHFRKCIGVPFGGNDVVDAAEWIGKKFKGYAVQETYKGVTRNKISKVSPMSDAEPVAAANKDEDIPF